MRPRCLLICLAVLLIAPLGAAAIAPATIAPEDLHPGDRAVVRTVFQGDSIEEFPAEIVGVVNGGRADGQLIVARALSERLRQLGVAQGMSGSPVYVNGKLAGALASSWPYEREPLFGITPIGEMLRLLELPDAPDSGPTAGPAGVDLPLPASGTGWDGLQWAPGDLPPATAPGGADGSRCVAAGPTALPVPLACSGMNPVAQEMARQRLEPLGLRVVAGGGSARSGVAEPQIGPGSAVAVDLLRGDLQLSAIGTVTWRDGDRVLLFGHPLFLSGGVRLPLSTASIVTVIASDYSSFKLGSRGREVGVVSQDRRAGVRGTIGPRARLLPLTVRIEGPRPRSQSFHFEMVEDRSLAPTLAGLATLNSLLEAGGSGGNQTLAWTLTLHRAGVPPLRLSDIAAGDTPTGDVANGVSGPLAFLFGNPFTTLRLDSIEVVVEVRPGRAQWTLRQARLLDAAVRPGGIARVECRLERWRGPTETRVLSVPVAEELPAGRYPLWVGGGSELTKLDAARAPARYRPTSLEDAWGRFAGLRRGTALHAAILADAAGVTRAGRDYPDLPASADALLSSGLSAESQDSHSSTSLVGETVLPLGAVVRGEAQLTITVDPKAP